MLSKISSEPLISISSKHNYKTLSKSPPASLLHCIGNILSHSYEQWRDFLTMAALSFTNGCSDFHLCTIFTINTEVTRSQRNRRRQRRLQIFLKNFTFEV